MDDPYVYENGTLINKLNITDYEKLRQAEADIGFLKLIDIDSVENKKFDINLIKALHTHIFEDIYSWAGEFRTVPIIKEELVLPGCSIDYSSVSMIEKDLNGLLDDLNNTKWNYEDRKEIAYTFARKMALIWRVHPFRDGNTRTILSFSYMFAKEHNFPFDIEIFAKKLNRSYDNGKLNDTSIRDRFVLACLDDKDYPEVKYLASTFYTAMGQYNSVEQTKNTK